MAAPDAIARLLSRRICIRGLDEPVLPSLLVVACERLHLEESVQLDPPTDASAGPENPSRRRGGERQSRTPCGPDLRPRTATDRPDAPRPRPLPPARWFARLPARCPAPQTCAPPGSASRPCGRRERQELRRHLHDDVVPSLAATRRRITAATGTAGNDQEAAHLSAAIGSVNNAVEALRSLARTMRPPELDALGLVPALRLFASRMSIPVLISGNDDALLPGTVESAVYQIAIKALLNTERRAQRQLRRCAWSRHPTPSHSR